MAFNYQTLSKLLAYRGKAGAAPQPDGTDVGQRSTMYGDTVCLPLTGKSLGLADEGSTFITSGTLGTGIATIAALTSLADTSPFIIVKNIAPVGSRVRGYLDLLKLIVTAAGTAGTALRYGIKIGPSRDPITGMDAAFNPTLGAATGVPQNVNADDATASILRVYAGPLVAPAAQGGTRQLGGGLFKSAIPVVNDQYLLNFGGVDPAAPGTQVDRNDAHPMVVIGAGQSAFIHIWLPSQSAASSYELQLTHHER